MQLSPLHRPGVYCAPSGEIELFVRALGGEVWRQHFHPAEEEWEPNWELVPDAVVSSGLSAVGVSAERFQLFGLGEFGELRRIKFSRGWGEWEDRGAQLSGPPAACLVNASWVGAWGRIGSDLWVWADYFGPAGWRSWSGTNSDPAVTCWGTRFDVFKLDAASRLTRTWDDFGVAYYEVATGLMPPSDEFVAVSRSRGRVDVVASARNAPIWHALWPRDPVR